VKRSVREHILVKVLLQQRVMLNSDPRMIERGHFLLFAFRLTCLLYSLLLSFNLEGTVCSKISVEMVLLICQADDQNR